MLQERWRHWLILPAVDRRVVLWSFAGIALIAIAVSPGVRPWLEETLTRHLLVQYPLIIGGAAIVGAHVAPARTARWLAGPAILMGIVTIAFWILPRWLDAAVAHPPVEVAKIVTLTLFAGLPLGWGWRHIRSTSRTFIWANATAMAAVMGWLQLIVPTRLCNSYLVSDQEQSGRALLVLALMSVLVGGVRAFFITPPVSESRASTHRPPEARRARHGPY